MTVVLLAIGLLATAAGFVTIGFGIPINAFSLGNTLIIAGTIAVATGLLLIGIAVAIGQLKRIAEALRGRGGPSAESVETMVPPTARMTPAAPPEPPMRGRPQPELALSDLYPPHAPEPPPEPRYPGAMHEPSGHEAPEPASRPLDWLRARSQTAPQTPAAPRPAHPAPPMPPMAEPPPMASDEPLLSPRPPMRPAAPPIDPAVEARGWPPEPRGGQAVEPRREPPRFEQPMPRATPQPPSEPPKEKFDLVWPERASSSPPPAPSEPPRRDAEPEMPIPPIPARPHDRAPERRRDVPPQRPASERGPAILKSGVIDGMPYTLYADGSIEAELPKGLVKFASVDALRAHLEKGH